MTRAVRRALDRATVARAVARRPAEREEAPDPHLPRFGADGERLGDPHALRLDWAELPDEYLPIERFRRRLHRVRMILRQRLTDYFAAATARH